jgi:hypothetical protein
MKLSKNIDRVMVRTTQVPESPRSLSIVVDLKSPLNGAPHWMTETLAGSALMKEASNCPETLQEYISRVCIAKPPKLNAQESTEIRNTFPSSVAHLFLLKRKKI